MGIHTVCLLYRLVGIPLVVYTVAYLVLCLAGSHLASGWQAILRTYHRMARPDLVCAVHTLLTPLYPQCGTLDPPTVYT